MKVGIIDVPVAERVRMEGAPPEYWRNPHKLVTSSHLQVIQPIKTYI